MALHPELPRSPYVEIDPAHRWFPADEALRASSYERLLPPLVAHIREQVGAWRRSGCAGASDTSRALLQWWCGTDHVVQRPDGGTEPFRWYFAQREAVESVIWLCDVKSARDKFDLLRFDVSGAVSPGMFPEDWPRCVVKMATGAGKTKALSLLIAWSFFHRSYEAGSQLSRNFLLIAPSIIVLDRLRADFDGLRIFFKEPVLPDNGHAGRHWRDDFQLALHLQDDVRVVREVGNLFLTNIHRVHLGDVREPTLDDDDLRDYFLQPFGPRPGGKTDLGELIREIGELAVFNDEAHHIHDERMAWFGSIRDIHHRMLQKDRRLALQIDVTATPRHDNGAIFHEKFADYLALGIEEWKKSHAEHERLGKKAVLFVMVDDTRDCDDVGSHPERVCPELQGAVLVIHTRKNGDVAESASGKDQEELELLRRQANRIDHWDSPYKAIVSVLMLKEGWDVRNVTTIVGLRAYAAASNILPEQTLGRGLRRMYFGTDTPETVSVMGTPAFMEFVESIRSEGVELELTELRLVGGYELLYGQVKAFVRERLFDGPAVDIDDPVVLRNLSESAASKRVSSTPSRPRSTRSRCRTAAVRASRISSACATCARSAPSTATGCRPGARCSTASSASPARAASSCASRASWTTRPASPRSRRTTSPWASGSTTSRPTATCPPTRRLHRQGRRRQHHDRRDQGPRRARPAAQDGAPGAVVRGRHCGRPGPGAGRATASSTSIKKASNDTRRSALRDSRPVSANTSKRLDASPETVNTAEMKTTFDLPDPLLRKAKAAAADQGRPLRDLVAEALAEKLAALALAKGARKSRDSEWKAFEARLEKLPDGTYVNPEIPEDDNFAQVLEAIREERLGWQPRNPFEPEADVDNPTAAPARSPARG